MKLGACTLALGAVVALAAVPAGGQDDPCARCKDTVAAWDWKANGYALGEDAEAALASARDGATESACKTAYGYLKADLKCRGACHADPAGATQDCEPAKEPLCQQGSHEKNPGMWTFVCRKTREKGETCDAERAKTHPNYAMCDVSVKAQKRLSCRHPECGG